MRAEQAVQGPLGKPVSINQTALSARNWRRALSRIAQTGASALPIAHFCLAAFQDRELVPEKRMRPSSSLARLSIAPQNILFPCWDHETGQLLVVLRGSPRRFAADAV